MEKVFKIIKKGQDDCIIEYWRSLSAQQRLAKSRKNQKGSHKS